MKRMAWALSAVMLAAVAGVAQANSVWIDYSGPRVVSNGLTQVTSTLTGDSITQIVRRGDRNTAKTGGTDTAHYLALRISPAFKVGLKSVWVTVEYFDQGVDGFRLQYDGQSSATASVGPTPRAKYDTGAFLTQTWHLTGFKLQGGQSGGSDLRIEDRSTDGAVDGPEYIASVTVSDVDPYFSFLPFATQKPALDGRIVSGEWEDAAMFTLDAPWYDAVPDSPFTTPREFSATFGLKYDADNLYVLYAATDTTPRLNSTTDGANYWRGDGFEIYIALDDANPERTTYLPTDFHVFVGLGPTPGWSLATTGPITTLDPIGNNIGITNTATGYIAEVQIPWTRLSSSARVQPGQRIAWYALANNSFVIPSAQQIALGPTGTTGAFEDPSRWIRGVLDLRP